MFMYQHARVKEHTAVLIYLYVTEALKVLAAEQDHIETVASHT